MVLYHINLFGKSGHLDNQLKTLFVGLKMSIIPGSTVEHMKHVAYYRHEKSKVKLMVSDATAHSLWLQQVQFL